MARLIDADNLIREIELSLLQGYWAKSLEGMRDTINRQPTVDAVPVVHGEWIEGKYPFCKVCSKCRAIVDSYAIKWESGALNYCPNCGADMRGEKE